MAIEGGNEQKIQALFCEKREFTPDSQESISVKLKGRLGPEHISSRTGPRGGWKIIEAANEIFGFNGWSHSVVDLKIDYEDYSNGRYNLGASAIVRVTLKDGAYHEDVGYGFVENAYSKGLAYSRAKKAAVTDATKRALRSFGEYLGNCMYDREYIETVVEYGNKMSRITKPQATSLSEHQAFKKVKENPYTNKNTSNNDSQNSKFHINTQNKPSVIPEPRETIRTKLEMSNTEAGTSYNSNDPLAYQMNMDADLPYIDPELSSFDLKAEDIEALISTEYLAMIPPIKK